MSEEEKEEKKETEPTPITDLPYDFDQCTISISLVLLPDDGEEGGRPAVITVQNHRDAPIVLYERFDNLLLPSQIATALSELREDMPNRKIAHMKAEEDKKKKTAKKKEPAVKTKKTKEGTVVTEADPKTGVQQGQLGMSL